MGQGEILTQGLTHAAPLDNAEQLARQIADGDGVIARGRARLPHRGLRGQPFQHGGRIEPQLGRHRLGKAGQAGLVAHHLADGDPVLARLAKGRPQVRDPLLIGQLAALDRRGHHQGHDRLAGRKDGHQGVGGKGSGPRRIGMPGPQVDHRLARDTDAEPRAQFVQPLGRLGEIGGEGIAHPGEALGAGAVDVGKGSTGHPGVLTMVCDAIHPASVRAATTPEAISACSR